MASGATGQDRTPSNSSREPWPVNNNTPFINQVTIQSPKHTRPVITDPFMQKIDSTKVAHQVPEQTAPQHTARVRNRKPTARTAATSDKKPARRVSNAATALEKLQDKPTRTTELKKPRKRQHMQPEVPKLPARSSRKRGISMSEQQSSEDDNRKRAKHSDGDSVFAPLIQHVSARDLLYTDEQIQHLCFTSLVSAVLLPFINSALANNTSTSTGPLHNLLPQLLPSLLAAGQPAQHTTQPSTPTTTASAGQNGNGLLMLLATAASQLPGQNSAAKTSSMEAATTATALAKETAAATKPNKPGQKLSIAADALTKKTAAAIIRTKTGQRSSNAAAAALTKETAAATKRTKTGQKSSNAAAAALTKDTTADVKQSKTGLQLPNASAHSRSITAQPVQDNTQASAKPVTAVNRAAKRPPVLSDSMKVQIQHKRAANATKPTRELGTIVKPEVKRSRRLALKVLRSAQHVETDSASTSSSPEQSMSVGGLPVINVEVNTTSQIRPRDEPKQEQSQHEMAENGKRSNLKECVQSLLRLLPSKLGNKRSRPSMEEDSNSARLQADDTASLRKQAVPQPSKALLDGDTNPLPISAPKGQHRDNRLGQSPNRGPQNTASSSLHVLELQQHGSHNISLQQTQKLVNNDVAGPAGHMKTNGNMQPNIAMIPSNRNDAGVGREKQLQTTTTSTSSNHLIGC